MAEVTVIKEGFSKLKLIFPYIPAYIKNVSTSTLNGAINALKFYYGTLLKKKFIYEVRRPGKHKNLPVILTEMKYPRFSFLLPI
ncbi:MAG: hypothetical protein SVO01_12780 [Thermotogota bacterium]|nr:hypothetical protein [Thermotogota bacterium]